MKNFGLFWKFAFFDENIFDPTFFRWKFSDLLDFHWFPFMFVKGYQWKHKGKSMEIQQIQKFPLKKCWVENIFIKKWEFSRTFFSTLIHFIWIIHFRNLKLMKPILWCRFWNVLFFPQIHKYPRISIVIVESGWTLQRPPRLPQTSPAPDH